MSQLIQLIYSSAAKQAFSRRELTDLLTHSRIKNLENNVTGMLLYSDGSFFQVLEGYEETLDELCSFIFNDDRHQQITVIIREPIPERSFGDWTMGYATLQPEDADAILGANDFFDKGDSFARIGPGRAKKLIAAFKKGRWRSKLSDTATPISSAYERPLRHKSSAAIPKDMTANTSLSSSWYSFAYQPIVNISTGSIFSHEALIRGRDNESASSILEQVVPAERHQFDEHSRMVAIALAARKGLSTHLNLNFLPLSVHCSPTAISSILSTAKQCNIRPDQLIIEIIEREIISDFDAFYGAINPHRGSGLVFAIDDFGSGYAGLNLLADFQPEYIKLDMHLVRDIYRKGPRQAIVQGILHTCVDLGIEIIAEGVESIDEFNWLKKAGITLFQGIFFAKPSFEELQTVVNLPT